MIEKEICDEKLKSYQQSKAYKYILYRDTKERSKIASVAVTVLEREFYQETCMIIDLHLDEVHYLSGTTSNDKSRRPENKRPIQGQKRT